MDNGVQKSIFESADVVLIIGSYEKVYCDVIGGVTVLGLETNICKPIAQRKKPIQSLRQFGTTTLT